MRFGSQRDLFKDGLCGLGGIRCLGDGTADDQHRGSTLDRFAGSGYALLVAYIAAAGTDSGNDQERLCAKFPAQRVNLFGRTDQSADSGLFCQMRQAQDLLCRGGCDSYGGQLVRVHAGEDGDGQKPGRAGSGCGLGCGGHHGWPTRGVDGQQGGSGMSCGANGPGYGVGDVVEFEIEEDIEAAIAEGLDEAVAGGVVKLHAHLEPETASGETVYEIERGLGGRKVEGYGEAFLWLGDGFAG